MENMASPTLSRLLHPIPSSTASNNIDTSAPSERTDKLCQDISNLMHDYELVSRIAKLVGSLKQEYQVSYGLIFAFKYCLRSATVWFLL